jgi:hypothetical protein
MPTPGMVLLPFFPTPGQGDGYHATIVNVVAAQCSTTVLADGWCSGQVLHLKQVTISR